MWQNVPWKLRKLKCKNEWIIIGFEEQNETKQKIFHSCTNYNCYGMANVSLEPRKLKCKNELIVVGFEGRNETKFKRMSILVL